ncbi:Auxin response factor 18 [Olea europaea subsp. europaea]|uniref:Auxin response factor 18 n=1 Tax=Olea europaea subsp. europaea TaxID=158383 RepID=A0A8S0TC34_OLEEU|nr:Auxin response factor 18 [Olea europaea subsp. europaea]
MLSVLWLHLPSDIPIVGCELTPYVILQRTNNSFIPTEDGHAKHALGNVDFRSCPRVPAYIPCRVSTIQFMADPETDEVFTKMRLVPVNGNEADFDESGVVGMNGSDNPDKQDGRGIDGGLETPSQWNPAGGSCFIPYGGFLDFLREDENRLTRNGSGNSGRNLIGQGKVKPESVIEAATLAASGKPFEVVYYP